MYPYLFKSTIVRRTHIGQGLIHSDVAIKPVCGNIQGKGKPSFKAILGELKTTKKTKTRNLKTLF